MFLSYVNVMFRFSSNRINKRMRERNRCTCWKDDIHREIFDKLLDIQSIIYANEIKRKRFFDWSIGRDDQEIQFLWISIIHKSGNKFINQWNYSNAVCCKRTAAAFFDTRLKCQSTNIITRLFLNQSYHYRPFGIWLSLWQNQRDFQWRCH